MSETPEEDAWKKMMARAKGLVDKGARVFGRNTYPTDKPEPNGVNGLTDNIFKILRIY